MKINVTVDLADFYSEEDGLSFSEQIKDAIVFKVKQEILSDWKIKIGEEFNRVVKEEVEAQKEQFITDVMKELVVNAKVKKHYSSGEQISISEWILS